ncbi:MAG: hypothetical protein FWE31_03080 [Firmicutes bacterium]|nr:hypothetical protein [Bacillota bacterium]
MEAPKKTEPETEQFQFPFIDDDARFFTAAELVFNRHRAAFQKLADEE